MSKMNNERILALLWSMYLEAQSGRLNPQAILKRNKSDRSLATVLIKQGIINKISNTEGYSYNHQSQPDATLADNIYRAYTDYKTRHKTTSEGDTHKQAPLFDNVNLAEIEALLDLKIREMENRLIKAIGLTHQGGG